MKLLFFTSLFVSLLLCYSSFLADATAAPAPAPAPASTPIAGSCNAMCSTRCAKSGIPKRCFKYCCICCNKCKCVPSGSYGNKSECPCYRDMVNSKGKPKCP